MFYLSTDGTRLRTTIRTDVAFQRCVKNCEWLSWFRGKMTNPRGAYFAMRIRVSRSVRRFRRIVTLIAISQPGISSHHRALQISFFFPREKDKLRKIEILSLRLRELDEKEGRKKNLKCKTLLETCIKLIILTFKQSVEFWNIVLVWKKR